MAQQLPGWRIPAQLDGRAGWHEVPGILRTCRARAVHCRVGGQFAAPKWLFGDQCAAERAGRDGCAGSADHDGRVHCPWCCSIAFGAALGRVAAVGPAEPWLIKTAGATTVAAGLFRRDHMLLVGPGFAGESW